MRRPLALTLLLTALSPLVPSGARAAGEASRVHPAAERTVAAPLNARPTPREAAARSEHPATPAMKGMRLPPALQAKLRLQLDQRVDGDLGKIRTLRGEAVDLLTTFVSESPREAREMPEAMMRLGELRWEIEREAFLARFKAWESRPVDQRGPTPEPNFAPSRDLFARVLHDYPDFEEYDLALYVDGFLATEQGKEDEALARFGRILRDYPSSRFVADAHMARAEALFSGKYDYAGALVEYEKVLGYKDSELYGLALFKSAWCLWRLGRTDEAAKRFVQVFEVTDGSGAAASASPRKGAAKDDAGQSAKRKQLDELQSEALKYLVEVFTEDEKNTAGDVYGFLTKLGGDRFAGKVVRALATTFFDQAHYERGIEAYELLLKLEPTSRDAGDWVLAIASAYDTLEDYPKLEATYRRAAEQYTEGGAWSRTQGDPAQVAATTARIEKRLRENATALHGKAQKDKTSRAEFEAAAGLYAVYLSRFGGDPHAYGVHFSLAEIDFHHLGRLNDAATHYLAAARGVPDAQASVEPGKSLRHDALYNALAALEEARTSELEARKGKKDEGETASDKTFAEALELYAQLYPTDPALPELLFRQGKLYYDAGVYEPAVKIWGGLVEKFPSAPYARDAGELILESFNRSKNYDDIEAWARRLKSAPAFKAPASQQKLDVLIVQSVFKQGEQKSQAGDHAAAGAAYLRAAKEFPSDTRAAQACVNAETEAQKAGDLATLKEASALVTGKAYRDRPESPVGAWKAATTLQAMGLFGDAAEVSETITSLADRDKSPYAHFEHGKDAAYNAVILREATGEHAKAVANGQKFLALYGSSPEADEVVFQMGHAEESAGRPREAAELYKRYLVAGKSKNADHRVEGLVALAAAQIKLGDEKAADGSLKDAVAFGKSHGKELGADGKYAAAHARYMQGERVLADFDRIQISGDVHQLSRRLKQKAELLKAASTVFLDVVTLGVAEWTTAALYQVGRTYESFAKALREAPPPAGLGDADKDAYTQQIEEFVVPVEERSLDAYENGWKKAIELGIYNQWTAKMREALGRLNAELYPPFKEVGFEVHASGAAALPPLVEAGNAASGKPVAVKRAAPSMPPPAPVRRRK